MKLRWLTNTGDPKDPYKLYMTKPHQTQADARREEIAWLANKHIGLPMATEFYTQEQLIETGMVGVYAYEDDRTQRIEDFIQGKTDHIGEI
jgi:hypothetical protein